ncbi:MAG: alkaline phosphatase family protein, partial [Phycisphaerales bacterium]
AKLKADGCFAQMGTTYPPLSPVAWSSFSTGVNPGKHNIYDFITRNPANYLPAMSSVRIREPKRTLSVGKYKIPLSKPELTWLRKSKSFWTTLGEHGVFSSVIRVPITFPPEKFHGVMLSAMCVPDIRGTQGTFTYYADTTGKSEHVEGDGGGERVAVERVNGHYHAYVVGPDNFLRTDSRQMRVPFKVVPTSNNGTVTANLHLQGRVVKLVKDEYSEWVDVAFKAAPGIKVRGVCRFMLKQIEPDFQMYCTAVQIDPDKPALPISHPFVYSQYLSKRAGKYATLGLAEDTWSLSERVMSEDGFLRQAYDIHQERERMFFDALRKVKRGTVICVFDGPDRIQHMFWRFLDDSHPACSDDQRESHRHAIRDMYKNMDELVGRVMAKVNADDVLIVMSDHGFKPFRRGVDLNAWLQQNGYLVLKDGATHSDETYLRDVDWSQTRAFTMGLAGIFINQKGREAQGIVEPGEETRGLQKEIAAGLTALKDPQTGEPAIHAVYPREQAYKGPYVKAAPDLIIGYNVGYRVSWESAVGKTGEEVILDNTHAWSGDHCIDPHLVPGVMFCNRKLRTEDVNIIDIAPTAMDLFGVKKPPYLDGKSLLCEPASN